MSQSEKNINPLLCDPETGVCEIPAYATNENLKKVTNYGKAVKIIYFTDPICSSCWGIEPQLRRLKLEYGDVLDVEYRMGGLLPDWSYNSGGISKPSDVAHHWDEVSQHYDMPIDGDVWLEDPLDSSYPPSIAFKAAQIQDKAKAILFLRIIREMVFLEKKNITKWEHLADAARQAGLDVEKLEADFEGKARVLFEEDLQLARKLGVRGFPTMFFPDGNGLQEMIYGTKPYASYEAPLLNLHPASVKTEYNKAGEFLFAKYPTLTTREFSELSGMPRDESGGYLQELSDKGQLGKLNTKNGVLWKALT